MSQKWDYERLRRLAEEEKPQERFDLEFKPCDELRWGKGTFDPDNEGNPKAREAVLDELSRDVSSMANSAGGTIIYGVLETKSGKAKGLDPNPFTVGERKARGKEWLDQVLYSSASPAPDVRITPVGINDNPDNGWYYVVEVQPGVEPHQARDKVYWRRSNTTRVPMEHYEVMDVVNRAKGPVLDLRFRYEFVEIQNKLIDTGSADGISKRIDVLYLTPEVTSRNYISAEYGTLRLTAIFPLTIRIRRSFSQKKTGVRVGNYQEEANAEEFRLDWSVHQIGGVVYPGTWTDFGIDSLLLEAPPANASSAALYLLKAQINGPNVPAKVIWYKMEPAREKPWVIQPVPEDEFDDQLVEQFWNTYHRCRRYFGLKD